MNKEIINEEVTVESPEISLVDAAKEIERIKAQSVPIEDYNKLKKEHNDLFTTLVEGQNNPQPEIVEKVDVGALREELYGKKSPNQPEMTNLEYVSKVLKLRNAIIEQGGQDPFINKSSSGYDNRMNEVADTLQSLVDEADGDSVLFTARLQNSIIETPLAKRRK